ncbi:MAG: M20 metallopeptidase family protein, partial [Bellilinea sp.]
MPSILSHAQELKEFSISLRRDLHMHPELGFQEVRTAGIVADELRNLGYAVTEKVGKTGVVGMMTGDESGPTVMLRFDMDALPIVEETGADYASQTPGVMHACGHDGHVTIGLTVARLLVQQKSNLKGKVKLVFQPAEEGLGGAAAMIEDGVLEYPRPDAALGLHLWNDHPVGWAAVTAGPFMTGADMFRIKITGKGGHGAIPNETIDPLIAGTQVVSALQSVVSRNISPFDFAVVSITRFQAGT